MSGPSQSEELQQLREQLAQLTRRVYYLEELLANHPSLAPASPLSQVPAPQTAPEAEGQKPPAGRSQEPWRGLRETSTPTIDFATAADAAPAARTERKELAASLESRIGGQWLNRIGIIAVLIGLSYFLKLAFENNWIGPATQVIIGLVAGIVLLFWSERFRMKGYAGFAYSLKAISFGALYLSLWAASQYYHLVLPAVTFFGMVIVTMTAAALSLRQNAELLAAFALAGGFLTPLLVATGQNHEIALLCYVALLDLGTLWMVAIKNWRRLLAGSFAGTVLLFALWSVTYYTPAQLITTLIFASFFFVLYALASFVGSGDLDRQSASLLAVISLLNAASYFSACYLMLYGEYRLQLVFVALAAAAMHFALSIRLREREKSPTPLLQPLYVAIAIGFITVAIPIKLERDWLDLGWLVEAAALFWAAYRSRSLLLRFFGVAALALGVAHLILVDSAATQPLILNWRFGLYLVAIAALALLARFAFGEGGEQNRQWAASAILALNVLALIALHCEIVDYFRPPAGVLLSNMEWRSLHITLDFTYSALWMAYGGILMLIGFWRHSAFLRWQAIILLAATAAKVFLYDIETLERGYRIAAFIVLGAILLAVSFFYQRNRARAIE